MLPTDPKTPWPPTEPAADYTCWSAWYSGKVAELVSSADAVPASNVARIFFWKRQTRSSGTTDARANLLHMPLAADIAQTSADLLFGDPVDLLMPEAATRRKKATRDATQARLEEIVDSSGLHNDLLEAAETCAAMGGVYLRATWDDELPYPFLTAIQADQAVPEWRWGELAAVTFWRELERDGRRVWRHLERHESGRILHGLYLGAPEALGEQRPLTMRIETAALEEVVTLPGGLERDVWYVPNVRPNQLDRNSPLGRPDIAGAEAALDALDETWTSLVRDIRLGKARILVPVDSLEPALKRGGRGAGKTFDLDREVFTELDGLDPMNPNAITPQQFEIRTEQHITAALAIVEQVTSKAGYSPQTFGLKIEGRAESGTALRLREQKTYRTLQRKRRYWQPAIQAGVAALLVIDRDVKGNRKVQPAVPMLRWAEDDLNVREVASTLNLLKLAEAASIETRVRMLNPTWDEASIAAEVERIKAETGALVSAPDFPDSAGADAGAT